MKKILCAIPCYNEEMNLASLIEDLRQNRIMDQFDVVFVDDCSKDATGSIIVRNDFKVIRHEVNQGYGGSVKTAVKYAATNSYDYLAIFPGDHQRSAVDLKEMYRAQVQSGLDVIVGSKFHIYSENMGRLVEDGAIAFFHSWLNFFGTHQLTTSCLGSKSIV